VGRWCVRLDPRIGRGGTDRRRRARRSSLKAAPPITYDPSACYEQAQPPQLLEDWPVPSIFSKLFGFRAKAAQPGAVQPRVPESRQQTGRREPPIELDWSQAEYVPLPPAPRTWEVDGREEFHREYSDPVLGPVLRAGFDGHHTKVLKLAVALSPEQRQGEVGPVIAQA
jgi:hypothetical protein